MVAQYDGSAAEAPPCPSLAADEAVITTVNSTDETFGFGDDAVVEDQVTAMCCVCYDTPRNTRLTCGHEILCVECARIIQVRSLAFTIAPLDLNCY